MEDIKRMKRIKELLIDSKRSDDKFSFLHIWLPSGDVDLLIQWLDDKIRWEQSYGKEGTP